jgi:4-hydroxy-2-oxoheptanedioate aldolase
MEMPRNAFKRALQSGEKQIGLFLGLANEYSAEVVATAGFDWLLIDGEHGPNDLRSILRQLQTLAAYPVRAVVRVLDHNAARIKQLLDGGAQSLMVPMVESAEQARSLVRAMRYPPRGVRGVGTAMARAARWNGIVEYFTSADAEMALIVQIESISGIEALDEILAVDGVDAVLIGPSDLAAAMGHLGKPGHPEVMAKVEAGIVKIVAAGKAAGIFSADPKFAAHYQSLGASFLLVGVDCLLLRNASVALARQFKQEAAAVGGASY